MIDYYMLMFFRRQDERDASDKKNAIIAVICAGLSVGCVLAMLLK